MKTLQIQTTLMAVLGLSVVTNALDLQIQQEVVLIDEKAPAATITIGKQAYQVPFRLNADEKTYSPAIEGIEGDGFTLTFDGKNVINPDPFITWGFGMVNNTANPLIVSLSLTSPLILPTPCYSATLDGGFTLTDSSGDGASLGVATPYVQGFVGLAPIVTSGAFTLSDPAGGPKTVAGTYFDSANGNAGAPTFSVGFSYTISPGDSVGASGIFELTPKACPDISSTAGLTLSGLILMTLAIRRKA